MHVSILGIILLCVTGTAQGNFRVDWQKEKPDIDVNDLLAQYQSSGQLPSPACPREEMQRGKAFALADLVGKYDNVATGKRELSCYKDGRSLVCADARYRHHESVRFLSNGKCNGHYTHCAAYTLLPDGLAYQPLSESQDRIVYRFIGNRLRTEACRTSALRDCTLLSTYEKTDSL